MSTDASILRSILQTCRTIAVVGLSAEWHRPSFFAAKYMQGKGYRILPVNPRYAGSSVLGMPCVARLEDIPEPVDLVDVFRRSEDVGPSADSAIALGAKCLWQQIGVLNHEADASAIGFWSSPRFSSITRKPSTVKNFLCDPSAFFISSSNDASAPSNW